MVFSSPIFLFLFLPVVLGIHFSMSKPGLRNGVLLLSSIFFYTWGEGVLVLLLGCSILIDYTGGLLLTKANAYRILEEGGTRTRHQKTVLALCLSGNLALLGFFKYFHFGLDNLNAILSAVGLEALAYHPAFEVTLPLGISFFTFQSMSYSIDVYRGTVAPTRNLLNFASYVTLFPQLVAGPIVRYTEIASELDRRTITLAIFAGGVRRIILGLGKKVLIANNMGFVADQIFALESNSVTTGMAWLATICYTLQIYFDFSGYSDMAIGLGQMLGFHFPENFNYPYISRSIREFWQRWHMTLSRWFRDYLYIPLGGNQKGTVRTFVNLFAVFLLCGLWHGASWIFVIWGLYHGLFLVLERTGLGTFLGRLWAPLRHTYTMLVVMVSWVIFRSEDVPQMLAMLGALIGLGEGTGIMHNVEMYLDNKMIVCLVLGVAGSTPILPGLVRLLEQGRLGLSSRGARSGATMEAFTALFGACFIAFVFLCVAAELAAQSYNPFIYFRF